MRRSVLRITDDSVGSCGPTVRALGGGRTGAQEARGHDHHHGAKQPAWARATVCPRHGVRLRQCRPRSPNAGTSGDGPPRTSSSWPSTWGPGGPRWPWSPRRGGSPPARLSPSALRLLPGGGAEQDPGAWWSAIVAAARRALELSAVRPSSIVGVGCTAQWSGTVAVDGDGAPLRPAVIWMDSRGSTSMKRQMRGPVSVLGYDVRKLQRWIRLTGGAPSHSGKDPAAHILWIRDVEPDVYGATFKFLEPVDWLNQRLTGRFSASYDSIAAHWVTDNRRIDSIDYDETLLPCRGSSGPSFPTSSRPPRSWGRCGPRRPRSSAFPPGCRWRRGRGTCIRPRWGPEPSPTSTATSTSGRLRGSRATCRSRRPTSCATWPPSPPPSPAATWWPTSTRRRAHV